MLPPNDGHTAVQNGFFEEGQNPFWTAVQPPTHTHDEEEADEDDGEGAHAHAEDLLLLHELAVVAREAAGAEAGVALHRLAVDAGAAVVARVVQALVAVHARLAVGRHPLPARAPAVLRRRARKRREEKGQKRLRKRKIDREMER